MSERRAHCDLAGTILRSPTCQAAAVLIATLAVAARHWRSDGLWLGDAAQHAMNGLFWWDYLDALPRDPMQFALQYYARYPVINPVKYPPLFYLLEGAAFAVFGTSPQVAKALVLLFATMAGLYTTAWARRWIGAAAGWTGAVLAFVPGMVLLSNSVMLNVPATALGVAGLYHMRRWLEGGGTKQLLAATMFLMAVLLTYYPGAMILSIWVAWALLRWRQIQITRSAVWLGVATLCALVPVTVSMLFGPVHASRHFPSLAFLGKAATWTFYWRILPEVVGAPALVLGLIGLAAGLATSRLRVETLYLCLWIAALIVGMSILPARDARYVLLTSPAILLLSVIGVASISHYLLRLRPIWHTAMLAATLVAGFWLAVRVVVPDVRGFREVAAYLEDHGREDTILYDGSSEGLFGFYLRASDPRFARRLARADKLVYQQGPTTTFETWFARSHVSSTDDVVRIVRHKAGSAWVAIETTPRAKLRGGQRILHEAMSRPEFELVRTFTITGRGNRRVDLYRVAGPVQPVASVDLSFPSFTMREFRNIIPVTR